MKKDVYTEQELSDLRAILNTTDPPSGNIEVRCLLGTLDVYRRALELACEDLPANDFETLNGEQVKESVAYYAEQARAEVCGLKGSWSYDVLIAVLAGYLLAVGSWESVWATVLCRVVLVLCILAFGACAFLKLRNLR